MAKERVVIFEGEDKFINPRNTVYDVKSGEANFIPDEPPTDIGLPPVDKIGDMPSDGDVRRTPIDLPPPDPEPPVDKPVDKPVDTPIDAKVPVDEPPPSPPVDKKPKVDEPPPVKKKEDFVPQEPKLPPVITTFPTIPLVTSGLGVAPSGRGGGGAGGGGEAEKTKRPFNWLWIILIGGTALYLLTRKKK